VKIHHGQHKMTIRIAAHPHPRGRLEQCHKEFIITRATCDEFRDVASYLAARSRRWKKALNNPWRPTS